jgi:hypothetical protein
MFPFVPVQVLAGCLDSLSDCSGRLVQPLATPGLQVLAPLPNATWLKSIGKSLDHAWIDRSAVSAKAAKSDGARVSIHMWDRQILLPLPGTQGGLLYLRSCLMRFQRAQLYSKFRTYMSDTHGADWLQQLTILRTLLRPELQRLRRSAGPDGHMGGIRVLRRTKVSTRTTLEKKGQGIKKKDQGNGQNRKRLIYCSQNSRLYWHEVTWLVSNQDSTQLTALEDFIMSYIDYFGVPKADSIRVVYNRASCGLNQTVWAPNFWLPTAKSATRVLNFNYCGVDLDLGEMFLNFSLPLLFLAFSGINLTPFKEALGFGQVPSKDFQLGWEQCWMGFRPSPYYSVRFYCWAEEFTRGDRRKKSNPLRWDEVRLNLPGDPAFDPTLPRVMK